MKTNELTIGTDVSVRRTQHGPAARYRVLAVNIDAERLHFGWSHTRANREALVANLCAEAGLDPEATSLNVADKAKHAVALLRLTRDGEVAREKVYGSDRTRANIVLVHPRYIRTTWSIHEGQVAAQLAAQQELRRRREEDRAREAAELAQRAARLTAQHAPLVAGLRAAHLTKQAEQVERRLALGDEPGEVTVSASLLLSLAEGVSAEVRNLPGVPEVSGAEVAA